MADRLTAPASFQLRLTPHGRPLLEAAEDAPTLERAVAMRLADAFGRGAGYGLLQLRAGEIDQPLPPAFVWWRDFAARYVLAVCLHAPDVAPEETPSPSQLPVIPPPTEADLTTLTLTAPMMPGAEYVNPDILLALWAEFGKAFETSLATSGSDLEAFITPHRSPKGLRR